MMLLDTAPVKLSRLYEFPPGELIVMTLWRPDKAAKAWGTAIEARLVPLYSDGHPAWINAFSKAFGHLDVR